MKYIVAGKDYRVYGTHKWTTETKPNNQIDIFLEFEDVALHVGGFRFNRELYDDVLKSMIRKIDEYLQHTPFLHIYDIVRIFNETYRNLYYPPGAEQTAYALITELGRLPTVFARFILKTFNALDNGYAWEDVLELPGIKAILQKHYTGDTDYLKDERVHDYLITAIEEE